MAINIGSYRNQINVDAARPVEGKKPAEPVSSVNAESEAPVKVTVSARAKELSRTGGGGVDQAKVERLKAALAQGTLKLDAKLVASRIVEEGHGPDAGGESH
jgi:flagellar biosynthesis anti-sigma factor FlgM